MCGGCYMYVVRWMLIIEILHPTNWYRVHTKNAAKVNTRLTHARIWANEEIKFAVSWCCVSIPLKWIYWNFFYRYVNSARMHWVESDQKVFSTFRNLFEIIKFIWFQIEIFNDMVGSVCCCCCRCIGLHLIWSVRIIYLNMKI